MREAHEKGTPVMRTLFYEFPEDTRAWDVETQYLYGPRYLVVPVLEAGQKRITAYLPAGARWRLWDDDLAYAGGQGVEVECRIEKMPVFERIG